jgi:hypothetical protein
LLQTSTTTSDRVIQTTSNGEVVTITKQLTPTATAGSTSSNSGGGSSLSGGSIAGIVIGVLGGLALIAGLVFLVFFYRRRSHAESPVPSQDMTDNRTSRGSSFMRGVFPQSGHMHDPSAQAGNGRPNQFTDNRLRTDAVVYSHGRRESSTSLQDNEDYSRPVLRVSELEFSCYLFLADVLSSSLTPTNSWFDYLQSLDHGLSDPLSTNPPRIRQKPCYDTHLSLESLIIFLLSDSKQLRRGAVDFVRGISQKQAQK